MEEYIQLGHMEKVDSKILPKPHYFLPHHCVLKPDSSTTKLRVVFDASAKTSSNTALNDIIATGPTIQDDLLSILLRFRIPRYVFTADIEKMYRQILVHEDDRQYQLILWRDDPQREVECYQLKTVTYGTTSAPYLATKCLQKLAQEQLGQYPLGAKVLMRDFYVDDVMTGADSLVTAIEIRNQLNDILKTAGFTLRKWCANHPSLLQGIPQEDIELQLDLDNDEEGHTKTLGVFWLPKADMFTVKVRRIENRRVTKRTAHSDIAHLFDPLGILGPVTVTAKIFLQKLWMLKLDWDASLPQELHSEWIEYREKLESLNEITIPRHITSHRISNLVQIHAFADASEKAYGAAIYLRSINKDNIITVQLLCAKSRVAPLKKLTLPRLELCAAQMAADLVNRINKSVGLHNHKIFLWTDSQIVLAWINSSSSSFHTFVANRIAAIQELTIAQQWRHVPSKENPADLLSRGVSPDKLKTCNLWFYGPIFLHGAESAWPPPYTHGKTCELERKESRLALSLVTDTTHIIHTIDHRNSFRRLQRVLAYVMRFVNRIRGIRQESMKKEFLSQQELHKSLILVVKVMQLEEFREDITHLQRYGELSKSSTLTGLAPFLDDEGIIRVGGRAEESKLPYDTKHPILLPYSHPFTKLLMTDIHKENLHCGPQALLTNTRQRFWPVNGKTIARAIVKQCVRCARAKPKLLTQLMGNLPAHRVQPARPFVNSGVDFCGPIWTHIKVRGKRPQKSYIAVFCCFATKATHLELVTDLSTSGFIGAIKRFTGRRGNCRNLYCDNATNFIGANNQLQELSESIHSTKSHEKITNACSAKGIDFHFIPPRAPHFGGLWEAAVKSAKHFLRRVVTPVSLTYEELETVIIEIEAIMNSRPLTPMSSDPNDFAALTPGHFLIGEPLTNTIDPEAEPARINLHARWKTLLHIKAEFWKRWSREYLSELQQRQKWKRKCDNIEPGTMVIIKEDNCPIMKWPLGRVIQAIKGPDGLVRVADVRTSTNILRRPIHKLAPLPISTETQATPANTDDNEELSNGTKSKRNDVQLATSEETEGSGQSSSPPKKKARYSPIKAITTLLLTCLLVPMVKCSDVEIAPFKSNLGIHFENLGSAHIISNEWNLVVYYNMTPYWREFDLILQGIDILRTFCNLIIEHDPCLRIIDQFQSLNQELTNKNELLQPHPARVRRGAFNIIGNVANSLFGVLDSEYAEKMSHIISNLQTNEDHLLHLIRNQTSIINSTANVMKRNQELLEKQLRNLDTQISQITQRINDLAEEIHQQKLSQLFLSEAMQLLLSTSNLQRTQSAILNVMIDTHHGKINAELISPQQLKQELNLIKTHLPPSLKLPISQDDLLKLYKLMTVQGRIMDTHIIFRIKLPLLSTEEFELFRTIPVPALVNNSLVAIRPSSRFLVINLHRDHYYPLTELELSSCMHIAEDDTICEQKHPIFHKTANHSKCELDIMNQTPDLSYCQFTTFEGNQFWEQLHNTNKWIYSLRERTSMNVVCGKDVSQISLQGSGILTIPANCIIKQDSISIQGHNLYPSTSRASFTSSGNLSDLLDLHKLDPLQYTPINYHSASREFEEIQQELQQQKFQETLPTHDIHQYTVGYTGLLLALLLFIYILWNKGKEIKWRKPERPIPAPRSQLRESFTVHL